MGLEQRAHERRWAASGRDKTAWMYVYKEAAEYKSPNEAASERDCKWR